MGVVKPLSTELLLTDIYAPCNRGERPRCIGWIESKFPLSDSSTDIIKLKLKDDYIPQRHLLGGDSEFSTKDNGKRAEKIYPSIWIETSGNSSIAVLVNGMVQIIEPNNNDDFRTFEAVIYIDIPWDKTHFERITISIPKGITLTKKIIQVVPYDIFLTAGNTSKLKTLWKERSISPEEFYDPSIPVKVSITSGCRQMSPVFFQINGLPATKVEVNYRHGSPDTQVNIYFSGFGEPLQETLTNEEFMQFTETKFFTWRRHGGIVLYMDTDEPRLKDTASKALIGTPDEKTAQLITNLKEETTGLQSDVEKKAAEILQLNNKLKLKEIENIEVSGKLAEASSYTKQLQEEFKTRREEVRYHSSKSDAESTVVIDSLKVVGAIAGFGTLLFAVLKKSSITNNLVEWGIPSFSGLSKLSYSSAVGVGTKLFIGAAVIIGGIVLLEKATGIFSRIYETATGNSSSSIDDAVQTVKDSVVAVVAATTTKIKEVIKPAWEAAKHIASATVTVARKVVEVAWEATKYVAKKVTETVISAATSICNSISSFFGSLW